MSAPNPKKWFPKYTAQIKLRKVDVWAERMKSHSPYFDTWIEAHNYMLERATTRLKRAKSELLAAERHSERVRRMPEPPNGASVELPEASGSDVQEPGSKTSGRAGGTP